MMKKRQREIRPDQLRERFARFGIDEHAAAALIGIPVAHTRAIFDGAAEPPPHVLAVAFLIGGVSVAGRRRALEYARSARRWRPIPGYSRYEASSDGDVRRAVHGQGGAAGLVLRRMKRNGYWHVMATPDGGRQKKVGVHRLIALAFHGQPPEDKPYVCHRNGESGDNRDENLYWGSALDNARDARRHAREKAAAGLVQNPWSPDFLASARSPADLKKRHKIRMIGRLERSRVPC